MDLIDVLKARIDVLETEVEVTRANLERTKEQRNTLNSKLDAMQRIFDLAGIPAKPVEEHYPEEQPL